MPIDVYIGKIDKVELLRALWNESKEDPDYRWSKGKAPDFNEEQAKEAVNYYIDRFCGRLIKTNLKSIYANSRKYDKSFGPGKFVEIVSQFCDKEHLEKMMKEYNEEVLKFQNKT